MKSISKLLIVALLFGLVFAVAGVNAQTVKDRFNGILVDHDADINGDLDVDGTANLDVVDIDGAVDMASTLDVAGDTTLAGDVIYTPQAATVAAGFSLAPTAQYVVMTSAAAVTSSTTVGIITSTATTGQLIILRNGNASDVIIFDGTGGTVECKANVALGASDTLTLIFNGAAWNCVSSYDNS